MLKKSAIVFGVVFLALGILGFFAGLRTNGLLFGLVAVDPLHNWVHVITGVVALIVGFQTARAARLYFQIFGVIYALVALLGLFYGAQPLLGIMAHNWAGFWLHLVAAGVALYLGFAYRERRVERRATATTGTGSRTTDTTAGANQGLKHGEHGPHHGR